MECYFESNFNQKPKTGSKSSKIKYTIEANTDGVVGNATGRPVKQREPSSKVVTSNESKTETHGVVMHETEDDFRRREGKSWMVDDCTPVRFGEGSNAATYGHYYVLSSDWTREENMAYNECMGEKKDIDKTQRNMDKEDLDPRDVLDDPAPGKNLETSNETAHAAASSQILKEEQKKLDEIQENIERTPHPDMEHPKLGPKAKEFEVKSIVSNPACPENNYGMSSKDCEGNCVEHSNTWPYLRIGDYAKTDCFGVCGGGAVVDCMGVCDGEAKEDRNGVCCQDREKDCTGACFGRNQEVDGRCCKKTPNGCFVCGPEGAEADFLGEHFDAYQASLPYDYWNYGAIKPIGFSALTLDCDSRSKGDPIPRLNCEEDDTNEHCKQEWPQSGYKNGGDCNENERIYSADPQKQNAWICPDFCRSEYDAPSIKVMQGLSYAVSINMPYHSHISGVYVLVGDPEESATEYSFAGFDVDGVKYNVDGARMRLESIVNELYDSSSDPSSEKYLYHWRIYGRYDYNEETDTYTPITDWTAPPQEGWRNFSILSKTFFLKNCDKDSLGRFPHLAPWVFDGSEVSEVSQTYHDYSPVQDKICAIIEHRDSIFGFLVKWQGEIKENQEKWIISYSDNALEYHDQFDNHSCSAWIQIDGNQNRSFRLGRKISGVLSTENLVTGTTYNNCDFKCGDQINPISVTKNLVFNLDFINVDSGFSLTTGEMTRPIELNYTKREYTYIDLLLNSAVDQSSDTNYYFEQELSDIAIMSNQFVFKSESGNDEFFPDDVTFFQKLDTTTGTYKTFAQILMNPIYKGEFVDSYPEV
jgi:hypothetical protein